MSDTVTIGGTTFEKEFVLFLEGLDCYLHLHPNDALEIGVIRKGTDVKVYHLENVGHGVVEHMASLWGFSEEPIGRVRRWVRLDEPAF